MSTGFSGRPRGYRKPLAAEFERDAVVDRVVGACMAVSRDACDAVGLLDDDLFAYVEDVDWCLRIRAAGFEVWQLGEARVWHHVSASGGGESATPYALYYGTRNTIVVCERHRPYSNSVFTEARRLTILAAFFLHVLIRGNRRCGWNAIAQGWRDARAETLGMWNAHDDKRRRLRSALN